MHFVDSSALIKAYIQESGTATVQAALGRLDGSVCISSIVALETAAALARLLRRREIRQKAYRQAREDFLNHCRTRFYVVHPPDSVVADALPMIDTYRARSPGGADLLHVATAEHLQRLVPGEAVAFICCDSRLAQIAKERGIDVFDPITDPISQLLPPSLWDPPPAS